MIEIIYKDEDLIVCVKPSGILSVEDSSNKENLMNLVRQGLSVTENKNLYPVHRLDRETSGLMVFARNNKSAAILSEEIAKHNEFIKEYLLVVFGRPENDSGIFEDYLFKDSSKNKVFVAKNERKGVKYAKLEYNVLKKFDDKSLIKVRLFTGRTHQIRVQFASRRMPIIGDRKYGGEKHSILALYSHSISFIHPTSKEFLSFESYPNDEIFSKYNCE